MSFDQFIILLQKGGPYGFALFFAAAAVVIGQSFDLWPFTILSQTQVSYVLVAGLIGAGLFVASVGGYAAQATRSCWRAIKNFIRKLTVMRRVSNLMPVEQAALLWIAYHQNETVYGNPLESPFRGLCREGFLTLTDSSALYEQAFRVNWQVHWRKKKLELLFPKLKDLSGDVEPPWKARRFRL